jgi:hypothetical protein
LAESPSFGQTILNYDSASHGATDYRALAVEVAEMQASSPTASVAAVPVAQPIVAAAPVMQVNPTIAPAKLVAARRPAAAIVPSLTQPPRVSA